MSDARPSHYMTGALAPESPAERAAIDEQHREGRTHRLGQVLREARERAGLDLSDVAEVTHVRSAYLSALEEGRYAELPEDVFTRNFLRLYAQAVRLDDEPLLELYVRERRMSLGMTTLEQRLDRDRRSAAGYTSAPAAASLPRRRRAAPTWMVGPWLPTVVLVALVVGIGLWGFDQLFSRPGTATAEAPAAGAAAAAPPPAATLGDAATPEAAGTVEGAGSEPAVAATGLAEPVSSLAAPSLSGVGTSATLPQVRVDVVTVPPGASITIDGFPIPGRTPLTGIPVTGREGRVVRAELEGYQTTEVVADLSRDAQVQIVLPGVGAVESVPGGEAGATAPSPATGGRIQITVTEASWLEVWRSSARNVGERLVYTTAQPGASYSFDGPVYVHVGNGGGVRVSVDGQERGAMGAPGAVLGRALP